MASSMISSKPFLTSSRRSHHFSSLLPHLRRLSWMSLEISLRHRIPKLLQIQAAGNTFGSHFRVTTYGESHGGGVGCVIDGCPPRLPLSEADIQVDLDRRRPGQSRLTTARNETDTCKIFSGVSEGVTTGTPIHVFVPNIEQRGDDYREMFLAYRPSHADATYDMKYGVRSGGGRSSAKETIARVASGAVAKKILKEFSRTKVLAYTSQVSKVVLPADLIDHDTLTLDQIEFESNIVRCPDQEYAEKMIDVVDAVKEKGDSVGGVVTCIVRNYTHGLGSPVFDKLGAELAKAVLSMPATNGFQFGSGFAGAFLYGSEHNDEFYTDQHGKMGTRTNRSGGIQGGISNGEIINMRIAFKPTPTIRMKQHSY